MKIKRCLALMSWVFCGLLSCGGSNQPPTPPPVSAKLQMQQTGQFGMNLLGWFVPERWLNRVLAENDSKDLLSLYEAGLHARMEPHLDRYIQSSDFVRLAEDGYQILRLSLGYWDILGWGHVSDNLQRVQLALDWAESQNLKVLIDLHGAPGSQNGYDHSGKIGSIGWYTPDHLKQTLVAIERVMQRFGRHPALWGIQPVNEPTPIDSNALMDFYERAYQVVRSLSECWITFSDAYLLLEDTPIWLDFFRQHFYDFEKVALDLHLYLAHRPHMTEKEMFEVTDKWSVWIDRYQKVVPVIIGEWSGALPLSTPDGDRVSKLFIERQKQIFSKTLAHFYANYKADYNVGVWDYRQNPVLIGPQVRN